MTLRSATHRAVDLSHEIVDGMITHPGIKDIGELTHQRPAARGSEQPGRRAHRRIGRRTQSCEERTTTLPPAIAG